MNKKIRIVVIMIMFMIGSTSNIEAFTDTVPTSDTTPIEKVHIQEETVKEELDIVDYEDEGDMKQAELEAKQTAVVSDVVEVVIGSGESHPNITALFQDPTLSGHVTAILKEDVVEANGSVLSVPDNYQSFTIKSDSDAVRTWSLSGTSGYTPSSLFANGKPFTMDQTISVSGLVSSKLFGGSQVSNVSSSQLTLNGYWEGSLYGGGLNHHVNGDVTITVNGKLDGGNTTADTLFGGGLSETAEANVNGDISVVVNGEVKGAVYGGGNAFIRDATNRTADVFGDINIELETNGSASRIVGGGLVKGSDTINLGDGSAQINGNVALHLNGKLSSNSYPDGVIGGGYIEKYVNSGPSGSDFKAIADIDGSITIVFGGDFQGSSTPMWVTGGGYVDLNTLKITGNQSASANVKSVMISAVQDNKAATSQGNAQAFGRLHGGGYARGKGAQANVLGDTKIDIARACWNSDSGLIGGGVASGGGQANVIGTANITIKTVANQKSSYENANGVFGGGFIEKSSIVSDQATTANVTNTNIHVQSNAQLISGSTLGVSIVGGGYAKGFVNGPAEAKVLSNITIVIDDNVQIDKNVYGGGFSGYRSSSEASNEPSRSNASVGGNIKLTTKEKNKFGGNVYGGSFGESWNTNWIADSSIQGSVSIELGPETTINGNLYGGSYAYYCANTTIRNDVTMSIGKDSVIWGDVAGGGNGAYGYTEADVKGSSILNLKDHVYIDKILYIGGATNSTVKQATLQIEGAPWNALRIERGKDTWNGVSGEANIIVGNGLTAMVGGLTYLKDMDNLMIKKDATLKQTNGDQKLFQNVNNIHIEKDATLELSKTEEIKKDFISEGTLALRADHKFMIGGNVSGKTNLMTQGTVIKDNVMIEGDSVDESGDFNYVQNGYTLKKVQTELGIEWKIVEITKPIIITDTLNHGEVEKNYSFQLEADSELPIQWSIGGTLPPGLTIDEVSGIISGVPSQKGNYSFQVIAKNGALEATKKEYTIIIEEYHSKVDIQIYKDNEIWNTHKKEIMLVSGNRKVKDLTNVPLGVYQIFIDDRYIGQDIKVENDSHSTRIDYFTVDVSLLTEGNITSTDVVIMDNGKQIENGSAILKNTTIQIIANATGTDEYQYLWDDQQITQSIELIITGKRSVTCHIRGKTNPPADHNALVGIETGDVFIRGETGRFEVVGSGLDNKKPIQGDVRWLPIRWKVNPFGVFLPDGPFAADFDTTNMKLGEHTLHVYFVKQIFDGTDWIDVAEECEKTVTFTINRNEQADDDVDHEETIPEDKEETPPTGDTTNRTSYYFMMVGTCFVMYIVKVKVKKI